MARQSLADLESGGYCTVERDLETIRAGGDAHQVAD